MATKKSTGSKAGKGRNVSLADEDRRYINESLKRAGGGMDEGGVFEALERFGLSSERVQRLRSAIADSDVKESIDKASEYLAEQIENAVHTALDKIGDGTQFCSKSEQRLALGGTFANCRRSLGRKRISLWFSPIGEAPHSSRGNASNPHPCG